MTVGPKTIENLRLSTSVLGAQSHLLEPEGFHFREERVSESHRNTETHRALLARSASPSEQPTEAEYDLTKVEHPAVAHCVQPPGGLFPTELTGAMRTQQILSIAGDRQAGVRRARTPVLARLLTCSFCWRCRFTPRLIERRPDDRRFCFFFFAPPIHAALDKKRDDRGCRDTSPVGLHGGEQR